MKKQYKYSVGWISVQQAREILMTEVFPRLSSEVTNILQHWDESFLPTTCIFMNKELNDGNVGVTQDYLWVHILMVRAFGRWLPKYVLPQ